MKRSDYESARAKALALFEKAHIVLSPQEREHLEVADLGLNDLAQTGLELVVYVNTARCCAKEMALTPGQTCPEHRHAPIPELLYPGKEETSAAALELLPLCGRGANPQPRLQAAQGQRGVLHRLA